MKAFKQINLKLENGMVFSYAAMLCFLCSFIILNPLFGQQEDDINSNKPEVRIDVNKEYDKNGTAIGYDTTYSWFWSGKEIMNLNVDSILEKFHRDFDQWNDDFERNHFQFYDSTITSYFDLEKFEQKFNMDDFLNNQKLFEKYNMDQEAYFDRLKEYQKEHQQLIEKYFGEPKQVNDQQIEIEQNKYIPKNRKGRSDKTGRI